jgi:hypothetical protein
MSSKIERLRKLFLYSFFLLVIFIILTPLLVQMGFSIFPEETLESILLLALISISWQIFRLYERSVNFREKEIQRLESEYQKREKDLLEAFAYLGKVNVQVSLIKSFLKKLKAPSSHKEAESYINEILRIVLSLSGKKWVTLRVIDMKKLQTLKEYWSYATNADSAAETAGIKIGNKEIVKWENGSKEGDKKEFFVFGSSGSELSSSRAFLVFLNGAKLEPDIEDFLRAAANQCEVLLTLFDLRGKV